MKVIELTESKGYTYKDAYYSKYPQGGTEPWLKKFGATAADVQRAREIVLSGPDFKAIHDLGFKDITGPTAKKNGTIDMQYVYDHSDQSPERKQKLKDKLRFKVLAHGRATGLADGDDRHGYPIRTPEPKVIEGDPVQSIVNAMNNALKKLLKIMKTALRTQQVRTRAFAPGKTLAAAIARDDKLMRELGGTSLHHYASSSELLLTAHKGGKRLDLYSLHANPDELDQPKVDSGRIDPVQRIKDIVMDQIARGRIPEQLIKLPLRVRIKDGNYTSTIHIKLNPDK